MDREQLLEQAEEWLNENCPARLIKQYDRSRLADFALSLLQWKDVADGLPEVSGKYYVQFKSGARRELIWQSEQGFFHCPERWLEIVAAYIPVPIPEYVKEQR